MVDARTCVTIPVPCSEAYPVAVDLDGAGWLPAVKRIRHIGGPRSAPGARYEVEVGLVGRHLRGVLVCRETAPPHRAVFALEDGMELTITITIAEVGGGCSVEFRADYAAGEGPLSAALERASAGPARREVARAAEQFAARFGRKAPLRGSP